jgi:hypothetical protein
MTEITAIDPAGAIPGEPAIAPGGAVARAPNYFEASAGSGGDLPARVSASHCFHAGVA